MATFLHSDYMQDGSKWASYRPDYVNNIIPIAGHGDVGNRANVARAIVCAAVRTPVVLAFVDSRDTDNITICHSPVFHPADPTQATGYDGHVVAVLGDWFPATLPMIEMPNQRSAVERASTSFSSP